jgi:hypothetical protein
MLKKAYLHMHALTFEPTPLDYHLKDYDPQTRRGPRKFAFTYTFFSTSLHVLIVQFWFQVVAPLST